MSRHLRPHLPSVPIFFTVALARRGGVALVDHVGHLRYCWWKPLQHGFVTWPEDWPYPSYHRDRAMGRG